MPWNKVEVEHGFWAGETQQRILTATVLHLPQGPVVITGPGGDTRVEAGDLVWIAPGRATGRRPLGRVGHLTVRLRAGLWSAASDPDRHAIGLLRQFDRLSESGPRLPVAPTTAQAVRALLTGLPEGKEPTPTQQVLLKGAAMTLLATLAADPACSAGDGAFEADRLAAEERIQPALDALSHQGRLADETLSVADLAALCDLHPSRFHSLFHTATGSTPHRYLLERRVALAGSLLQQSHRSILEVAFASGFASQSRFYAAFTRITGMTPAQWRAKGAE